MGDNTIHFHTAHTREVPRDEIAVPVVPHVPITTTTTDF
jgi:hypothetical protein